MSTSTEIYDSLRSILSPPLISRHQSSSEISDGLKRIRRIILTEGIPEVPGRLPLRPRIWKLLLKVDSLQTEDYLRWVSMGPSSDSHKTAEAADESQPFKYVQGMNVLSAPFLFTLPSQLEAFQCFSTFIENGCPLYVQPSLKGVHKGLTLLDRCLEVVDPELYDRLASKNLKAEIYAFPSVMTFCACTPPLEEVLRLWDFLLAFGLHLNILCVIAQLLLIRQDLMDSPSPMKILRTFPSLDARPVIGVTVALVKDIPEELYRELVAHPFSC
ncbi:hypothetical protein LQV05_001653 [Cryptococcus neoformans]|nr:hypothetical protein LQV05_001653 [Cryptococcus neoformans]